MKRGSARKLAGVVRVCNPSILEVEVEGSGVGGDPQLHRDFAQSTERWGREEEKE